MTATPKPTVLFVQSDVLPQGGRTAVFAWMLQTLRDNHELTVYTWKAFDLRAFNAHYGTTLQESDVRFVTPSAWLRWTANLIAAIDPDPGSIQRTLLLARAARRSAAWFDLTIGCEMESDWGVPGLQYIHYPWLGGLYAKYAHADELGLWRKLFGVLRGNVRPWQWLADFSFRRMRLNQTLTNSNWTGERLRAAYGVAARTLYPPAPGVFEEEPWTTRANGFVVVGRIHPQKRMDWLVEALAPLRDEIPDMHLHLVGTAGVQREEKVYLAALQELVAANGSWVSLHLHLSRAELTALAVRQRYGVHAMIDEHFGIAVAEMVRSGCISFVHKSGGAAEIVNSDPRLLYSSAEDLRTRVLAVARDADVQEELLRGLARGAERFSPERFQEEFGAAVAGCLQQRPGERQGWPHGAS